MICNWSEVIGAAFLGAVALAAAIGLLVRHSNRVEEKERADRLYQRVLGDVSNLLGASARQDARLAALEAKKGGGK